MSDELTIQSSLAASKGGESVSSTTTSKTQTMSSTAVNMAGHTQEIGTSEEAIDLVDVDNANATGDEYWLRLRNMDATHFVDVYAKIAATPTYWHIGRMRPGESWGPNRLPKLDGSSLGGIFAKADTAACLISVEAAEAGDPAA